MPYFHGIVVLAGKWLRLLTGAAHIPGTNIKEEFQGGQYVPAFLEHFWSGKYRVEVRKLFSRKVDLVDSAPALTNKELFSSEVIRWSNSSDQYMLRIKGNDGWLASFKEIGLLIGNSKKMSKRLVELVRMSCMWLHIPEEEALEVDVIDHKALGMPDEYVDGATFISRGLAIKCVKSNTSATRAWRAKMIWNIRNGSLVIVQFRMLCALGEIKGNAVITPRRQMRGYEVRTFAPNIKAEIKTTGWQWVTLEPSYGAIPVKSDDLTHSIYWDVKGLYDQDSLLATLESSLKQFKEDLVAGKRSEWMEKLAENSGNILHEESEVKYVKDRGLVGRIQHAVAQLSKLGVPLNASQTLMFLSVNGLRKQLLGDNRQGEVWTDKSRHWFPVEWAYAAHIYTKEVLEIGGFKMPAGNEGFFHEATHSFVVPGQFLKDNFENWGGPDLDDTVKVHVRRVSDKQGKVKLMGIVMRNPNDFGEYAMIPLKETGPVFHDYGAEPPLVDLQELSSKVPQFTKLKKHLNIGSLPAITNPRKRGDVFSLEDEKMVREASQAFPPGMGGTVIPKMIWYAQFGKPIKELVATNEDIVDVLQQGQASLEDVKLIKQWIDNTFDTMGEKLGWVMDRFWFMTRLPVPLAEKWEVSSEEASPWVTLHKERETLVRQYIKEMTDWLNSQVVMPDVLSQINWSPEERSDAWKELAKIKQVHQAARNEGVTWCDHFVELLANSDEEHGEERTDRKILRLAHQAILTKAQAPGANHDQWLFSFNVKSEMQPYMFYVRALKRVQDGTYNW